MILTNETVLFPVRLNFCSWETHPTLMQEGHLLGIARTTTLYLKPSSWRILLKYRKIQTKKHFFKQRSGMMSVEFLRHISYFLLLRYIGMDNYCHNDGTCFFFLFQRNLSVSKSCHNESSSSISTVLCIASLCISSLTTSINLFFSSCLVAPSWSSFYLYFLLSIHCPSFTHI